MVSISFHISINKEGEREKRRSQFFGFPSKEDVVTAGEEPDISASNKEYLPSFELNL